MKLIHVFVITIGCTLSQFSFSQCAVDVQIQEGATIEMCADNPLTISGTAGFINYAWTGPETQISQVITPNFSGVYTLSATDAVGCISQATITVTINPVPADAIISSEGNPICGGAGTTLSLPNVYTSYSWTGGVTTPTLFAAGAGTYDVTVVDNIGCTGTSSIELTEADFELDNPGSSVCAGGTTTLTASGGTSYVWSTGETGTTIVVSPTDQTVYSVVITQGSCSQTLSTTVVPAELDENILPDTMYVGHGQSIFVPGPSGFQSYLWSPTTNINNPFGSGVTFTSTVSQTLYVEATHAEGCVYHDSVRMIVVDLTIPNGFSPNLDGKNDTFRIPEYDEYSGGLSVWNRWGDLVLEDPTYENDWTGTCETSLCLGSGDLPEGTYFYLADVQGITFKGYITLKR